MKKREVTKKVYFVRHGQSEGNIDPVFQTLDSPLNEKGKDQAQYIAERATNLPIEVIISSPLPRAKETAEIIAEKVKKTVEFSDLFVERKKPTELFGKWYGEENAEHLFTKWKKSLYTSGFRAEDGENFDDLTERAKQALEYLSKRPEKELLVTTHGWFLRTIIAHVILGDALDGKTFEQFQDRIEMENTGLTVLIYDENMDGIPWRLWVWNDHAHLG